MRLIQLFTAVTVFLALIACASVPLQGYEGPPLPDAETALIQTRARQDRANIMIADIDGQDYTALRVRVLPGDRCITIRVSQYLSPDIDGSFRVGETKNTILCFEAIAGRTYQAGVSPPTGESQQIWIVDLETGETVAERMS